MLGPESQILAPFLSILFFLVSNNARAFNSPPMACISIYKMIWLVQSPYRPVEDHLGFSVTTPPTPPSYTPSMSSSSFGKTGVLDVIAHSATATVLSQHKQNDVETTLKDSLNTLVIEYTLVHWEFRLGTEKKTLSWRDEKCYKAYPRFPTLFPIIHPFTNRIAR